MRNHCALGVWGVGVTLLFFAGAALAETRTLIDERFADGDQRGYTPPDSIEWFGCSRGSVVLEGEKLVIRGVKSTARHAVAAFQKELVALKDGGTLELTFEFTPLEQGQSSGNSLRFGLFAVEDVNVLSEESNPDNVSAQGVVCALSLKDEGMAELGLFHREGEGRLLTNSRAYHPLRSERTEAVFSQGETYAALLRITRKGDQIDLYGQISSGSLAGPLEVEAEFSLGDIRGFNVVGFSSYLPFVSVGISRIKLVQKDS